MPNNQQNAEAAHLGPAERIIQQLVGFTDHMVHNRPGMVTPDGRTAIGVRWAPVTHSVDATTGAKTVLRLIVTGKPTSC